MAGDWLKVEAATPDKPEVFAITALMGWDDPDLTVGKLFRLWRWFDQHTLSGNADNVTSALLDRIVGVPGFCSAVEKVGWLVVTDRGVELPQFDRHNGKTAKTRALTAKRVAKHKDTMPKSNDEGNGAIVTSPLPREEKRREDISTDRSSQTPPLAAVDSMVVLEGTFEGNTGVASPNPVAPFAIALTRAGFQVTTLNPELIEFQREGGSIEHLEQLATQDQFVGKPATYLLKAARRELTERPSEIRLSLRQPPASNTEQGLIGLERLKKRPRT